MQHAIAEDGKFFADHRSARGKLVDVRNEAPIIWQERLRGQALFVAALMQTVDYAEIVVVDGSALPRRSAELAAFGGAAPAEILRTQGGVHPIDGRPVKFIAEDETFAGAVSRDGNQNARLAEF